MDEFSPIHWKFVPEAPQAQSRAFTKIPRRGHEPVGTFSPYEPDRIAFFRATSIEFQARFQELPTKLLGGTSKTPKERVTSFPLHELHRIVVTWIKSSQRLPASLRN